MKKMVCGTAAFLALSGLVACFSDPAATINNGNYHIVSASPSVAWVRVGDSDQVLMRFTNDANNGLITTYNIINPYPNGIAIHQPACYRPYFIDSDTLVCPAGGRSDEQYYVVGLATGEYSFMAVPTVNTADTGVITVRVPPRDMGAALSKTTAASGDTITVTAPALTKFITPAAATALGLSGPSIITLQDGATATTVRALTAAQEVFDSGGAFIKFAATHNDTGFVSVTNVHPNFPDILATIVVTLPSTNVLNKVP